MGQTFKDAISDHLRLKERNRRLEAVMPLLDYRTDDEPFEPRPGVLDPDGPHGWPSAEGLGLLAPAELWTMAGAVD